MAAWQTDWIDITSAYVDISKKDLPANANGYDKSMYVLALTSQVIGAGVSILSAEFEVSVTCESDSVSGNVAYGVTDSELGWAESLSIIPGQTLAMSGSCAAADIGMSGGYLSPLCACIRFLSDDPWQFVNFTVNSLRARYTLTGVNPDPGQPDNPEDGAQSEVFVHTLNAGKGKWSRYLFPFQIDAFSQLSGELFIRTGDTVVKVTEDVQTDSYQGSDIGFAGRVQWPWIDAGQPGATKQLIGFDLVASGQPFVSVGYNQSDTEMFTEPYLVPADTLTGGVIPMPLMAPSFSLRLDFAKNEAWNMRSATLYLNDGKWQP